MPSGLKSPFSLSFIEIGTPTTEVPTTPRIVASMPAGSFPHAPLGVDLLMIPATMPPGPKSSSCCPVTDRACERLESKERRFSGRRRQNLRSFSWGSCRWKSRASRTAGASTTSKARWSSQNFAALVSVVVIGTSATVFGIVLGDVMKVRGAM